jgi:phage RecT family recombinase
MQSNNAVANVRPIDRFKQELVLRKDMMAPLLPKTINFDKFQAIVIAAVGSNPDLLDCDRGSLLKSCIQAAELGLSLNPTLGEGDILKVWNNRTKKNDAQFRPRYMGLMKLARQSGEVMKIEAEIVRENDEFLIQKGDEPRLEHRIKLGKRGEMIGAYCIWTLKDGNKQFEVMDRDQILAIRDRSSAKTKDGRLVGPWATDEEEMWRKTVVRRASKYMPRATDAFVNAVALDNLHEVGHEVEIQNGEVIDVTAEVIDHDEETGEIHEAAPAASQMDRIAKKVSAPAPEPARDVEVTLLQIAEDDDGDQDWDGWVAKALKQVSKMSPTNRSAWRKLHLSMLDEAELMNARDLGKLISTLKG